MLSRAVNRRSSPDAYLAACFAGQQPREFGAAYQLDRVLDGKGTCVVGGLAGGYVDALMRIARFFHGVEVVQRLDARVRHLPALAVDERGKIRPTTWHEPRRACCRCGQSTAPGNASRRQYTRSQETANR